MRMIHPTCRSTPSYTWRHRSSPHIVRTPGRIDVDGVEAAYRRRVYQIIRGLRTALKREVRRAEQAIKGGGRTSVGPVGKKGWVIWSRLLSRGPAGRSD